MSVQVVFNQNNVPTAAGTLSEHSTSSSDDKDEPSKGKDYHKLKAESSGHLERVQQSTDQAYAEAKHPAQNSLGRVRVTVIIICINMYCNGSKQVL